MGPSPKPPITCVSVPLIINRLPYVVYSCIPHFPHLPNIRTIHAVPGIHAPSTRGYKLSSPVVDWIPLPMQPQNSNQALHFGASPVYPMNEVAAFPAIQSQCDRKPQESVVAVVVVVVTLKCMQSSIQYQRYLLPFVLVQLTRAPSVVTRQLTPGLFNNVQTYQHLRCTLHRN